jgi:hypothetical protein
MQPVIIRFGRCVPAAVSCGLPRVDMGYPRPMLSISPDTLREGCERAQDLFSLNSRRERAEAADSFDAVFEALGFDYPMRARLQDTLTELVPVKGDAMLEANTTMSMAAGVLIGLLIADSSLPADELDLPVVVS